MGSTYNSARSLTEAKRIFDRMFWDEVNHFRTQYCHPQLEYPEVQGPLLIWDPSGRGHHQIAANVSAGEARTRVYVYVIPPRTEAIGGQWI